MILDSCYRMYCETPGLEYPTGLCDPGWYCTARSISSKPVLATRGGQCRKGYYCPRGSAKEIGCDKGMYCANIESAAPTGNCSAGYFCLTYSQTPTPTDGVTGKSIV